MKISQSSNHQSQKFRVTAIAMAVGALMILPMLSHAGVSDDGFGNKRYNKLGDLTIYQPSAESNKPTLTLMLDKSGSMRGNYSFHEDNEFIKQDIYEAYKRECTISFFGICFKYETTYRDYISKSDIPSDFTYQSSYKRYTVPGLTGSDKEPCVMDDNSNPNQVDYYNPIYEDIDGISLEYCEKDGERVYDRMSKLKLAMIELLSFENVDEDIIMGVGAFGYNNYQGQIKVAAKPLDSAQKNRIYDFLRGLSPSGGTPMATAFTDAGAYMLGNSTYNGGSSYSGMRSTNDSSIVRNNQYIAPETQQCGAKGVYLLTDGFPNNISSQSNLKSMMKQALNVPNNIQCSSGMLRSSDLSSQWDCIGDFATQLRTQRQITTAMVGFGGAFGAVDNPDNYISVERVIDKFKDSDGRPYRYNKKYYDCSKIPSSNPDARNACNLGMESGKYDGVGGYGQGGFYFAKDTQDIVGSVLSVIQDLEMDLPSIPAGTISVPQDPLSTLAVKPYAYLPMLEPKVGSDAAIWPGNLKKYHVSQGTLFGQDGKRLYIDGDNKGGFPDDLNPDAQDIWSTQNETMTNAAGATVNINDRITSGGFYAQLKSPKQSNNTSRNVYVESNINGSNKLVKVGVTNGNLVGFDSNTLDDSYTTLTKLYLLSFLGYDVSPTVEEANRINNSANSVQKELEKLIINPPGDIKVLGGVVHSRPALITYGANINATDKDADNDGEIDADAGMVANTDSDRKDYVMFGSMEGALHIASAETGQENIAFIPKKILQNQIAALQPDSTVANAPVFGVDAPWTSKGQYKYDFSKTNSQSSGEITTEKLYIYGGLRQGGKGLYGLDVTKLNDPKMLFSIDETSNGYQALGMAWSEPVTGRVQIGSGRNSIKDVIVFGGGYDECYEDPTFKLGSSGNKFAECNSKSVADGNAVYIADAETGNILWSISGRSAGASGKHIKVPEMKHSVVSKITTLDRDDDGFMDHLYFGDLGGQVFRVDLRNGQPVSGSTGVNNFTRRVVRVLNTSGDNQSDQTSKALANKGLQYRFYGQPSVSFHKDLGVLFGVVNIASGDRSNPLSNLRDNVTTESNRLFGIIDRDIAKQSLYGKDNAVSLVTKELNLNDFTQLPYTTAMGSKDEVQAPMRPNEAQTQGWTYSLNLFDGFSNVKNVKSMGDGIAIGGVYYMTAYSPEMRYDEVSGCAAQVVGGSERQMYCLPYGICESEDPDEDTALNGTGGFVRAGKGIQELVFGSFDADNPTTRVLLGTQTLSELANTDNRIDYNKGRDLTSGTPGLNTFCPGGSCFGVSEPSKGGGSGSGGGEVTSLSYRLLNTRWYEQTVDPLNDE